MKKLLYCAAALATLLIAGSCQRENLAPAQESAAVTFTVEAPAALQTRAIADGLNVNELIYEVWLTETLGDLTQNAQKLYQAKTDMAVENGVNKATLTLDLVNDQKFTVLFWAQVKEAAAYTTAKLTEVTYAKNEYNSNDESLAAFYAVAYVNDSKHVEKDGTTAADSKVSLRRPFAQLNLGTLNTSTAYTVTMVSSEVKVTSANTVFNVATSVASVPAELTFKNAAVPADPATLSVNGTAYQYAAMNYLFAGDNAIVEYDIETKLNGGMDGTVNNIVDAVPLKENYRTNIIGNLLTSKTDYEIVVDAEFEAPDEYVGDGVVIVKDSQGLVDALKRNESHLVIELLGTQTKAVTPVEFKIPVGAHEPKYYFGGEKTKTITINANGNTINFDHKNTDWNYIRCVNDAAKWIINDAVLTNSGANDGPWNRHDIRFYNAVELTSVTSDKAIALLNDGKLNNVTITEDGGVYGLWITAEGQTVDVDGLNITATNGGRGIAIKDEYVDSPACVTLNVNNATFETAEKAAILVTSTAGAEINWGAGNDIKGVAADPINAVWVDDERADYASEVNVKGASKVVEGAVENVPASDQAALTAALEEAAKNPETTVVVNVAADTYGTLPALSSNVVLNCAEGTVFEGTSGLNVNGATVIGATFEDDGTAVSGTIDGVFKNCTFDASEALRWCYTDEGDEILFEDCVIKTDFRGFHFDGMNGNVTFRRCEINGFNAYGGNGTATFENCVFGNDESGYNGLNTYSNTVLKDCKFVYNSGKTNFIDMEGTGKTLSITNCTATLDGTETPVIDFVGGSKLDNNTVILDGKTYASSQTSLSNALNNGATEVLLKDGNYTMPEPDLRGKGLTVTGSKDVVIDAQAVDARDQFVTGATLKFEGVTLNFGKVNYMGFANTASLTYKDCDINGLQFLFGENVVFENCDLDSNGAEHTVWTYGVKNVSFTGCDFTYGDRGVNCYSDNDVPGGQTVNFTKCTFATENTASEGAVEINSYFISGGIVVNMEGCTAPAYGEMAYVSPWDSTNGAKTTINIK
ncbi:MAG: right-handed parallel beta-helix repeat-containing protein [Bacteroidales bacterium]|nr:right-handed parallel beta-helix repeat-containing protein [Bacteroidales bacterium]